jgi:hypothetical protein
MSSYPMRVQDLPGALIALRKSAQPFQPEDVTFEQPRVDHAFLKEITENRRLSEAFIMSRGFIARWNADEILLRAYVEPIKWKGSQDQYRSSIGIPILAENFYSLLSAFQQTLFSGNRPFLIDPGPSTKLEVAQAQEALITAQLKAAGPKGTSGKQQIRGIGYEMFLYGTGVCMVGWQECKCTRIVRRKKEAPKSVPINDQGATATIHANEDDIEEIPETYYVNRPVVEHVPLRRVRFAPDCRQGDIRTGSWRGRIFYASAYDLDEYRGVDGYEIPTREQLISLTTPYKTEPTTHNVLETQIGGITNASPVQSNVALAPKAIPESLTEFANVDPLAKKFEIFEYITDKRVGWVLENQYLIKNKNLGENELQMFSCNFREAPDSFLGYGLGWFVGDFQHIAQGLINYGFDNYAIELMGTYQRDEGVNISSQPQWMFPGKVAPKGISLMDRGKPAAHDFGISDKLKSYAASIAGAGAGIQGVNPGSPGDMRTKQGVQTLNAGDDTKLTDLVDQVCELIFVPMLEFMVENNRKLKPSQLRQMLSQVLEDATKADPLDVINGNYKVSISAGAKLRARQALNQALGYIQSVLQQPSLAEQLATAAVKIDWPVFIKGILEGFGYPYQQQLIVPMTDEDKQRLAQQQQSPGQKVAGELLKVQAQTAGKQKIDENQGEIRAMLATQKAMFEHSDREAESAFSQNGQ